MRFPLVTFSLSLCVLAAYLLFSQGTLFIPNESVFGLAFGSANPLSVIAHLFVHVGPRHLAGNLLPMVLFAALLEAVAGGPVVALVFFASGMVASVCFSFFNPLASLAGASGGVAGLIGAACLASPKRGVLLLLLLPFVTYLLLFPIVDFVVADRAGALSQEQRVLSDKIRGLEDAGRTAEAVNVSDSLSRVAIEQSRLDSGVAREREVRSDVFVHVLGAILGMLLLWVSSPRAIDAGGVELFALIDWVKKKAGYES